MYNYVRHILILILILSLSDLIGQIHQKERFELEKKNTDDYFTVLSAGENGAVVIRDTDDYRKGKGDVWQIIGLDTALTKQWENELFVDTKHVIKGYELVNSTLYLLFREGDYEKSDYHLVKISVIDGTTDRYDIKNELELGLSHMIVVNDRLILAGYVRFSPTLLSYTMGDESFNIIPGFFKDRSHIVDLRINESSMFNSVTLEKDYGGYFLRFRTYSSEGDILFEREVIMEKNYSVLSAQSTNFTNGNVAIAGTYAAPNSKTSLGIYFILVRPEGQKNTLKYYPFSDFEHFFDYLGPKRAKRMEEKIEIKAAEGKEFKFGSRLLFNEIELSDNGFLMEAEIYNPEFDNSSRPSAGSYYGGFSATSAERAYSRYARQTSRLAKEDGATGFEYKQSLVFKLNSKGKLEWDNSFKIEDVETISLEQVVGMSHRGNRLNMLYRHEEELRYKIVTKSELVAEDIVELKLTHPNDEVKYNYDGIGSTSYWYDQTFFVWGYHRVENKTLTSDKTRRNVLFINKISFE